MQIEIYFQLKQLFKLGILVNQIKNLGPNLKHNINFGNFYMISIFSPKKKRERKKKKKKKKTSLWMSFLWFESMKILFTCGFNECPESLTHHTCWWAN